MRVNFPLVLMLIVMMLLVMAPAHTTYSISFCNSKTYLLLAYLLMDHFFFKLSVYLSVCRSRPPTLVSRKGASRTCVWAVLRSCGRCCMNFLALIKKKKVASVVEITHLKSLKVT